MTDWTRRRSFAIISHPDAGKTTLTEKMLLYAGALHLAGSVTARKNQRSTASDWMEMEKKRGISISSTVLQFDCAGYRINLLDTPGHRDFSEDTYRVLTAVDAVIMVLDAGKGIESQTLKLFEVCRQRGIPIFTFINKLDRPTREPLELLDEIEEMLDLAPFAMNWPIGTGLDFKGVYDRRSRRAHLFEHTPGGAYRAPEAVGDQSDEAIRQRLSAPVLARYLEEVDMLDSMGTAFDKEAVLAGHATPVFFGSAANNFGVQLLLDGFLSLAPGPAPRRSSSGMVGPETPAFSGFIFKIQGNMDPKHRDHVAFMRICSGKFTRDMSVTHQRTKKRVRLSNSHKLFGAEREIMNEAWPGDIIGLIGHSDFLIGDTLSEDPAISYDEIPRFPPECFALLHNPTPAQYKSFRKGLDQVLTEGVVQRFRLGEDSNQSPLLAAVGPLQFEVAQYRLKAEYGADSRIEFLPWTHVRWPEFKDDPGRDIRSISIPVGARWGADDSDNPVIFFQDSWAPNYLLQHNPGVVLNDFAPKDREKARSFSRKAEK
ncbi:MAG TPA: peptide chain release factor 3 [Elusimicrobiales bacterium]|nr:peptide chain release factor 3 [Elusimicrobiales bacterium]